MPKKVPLGQLPIKIIGLGTDLKINIMIEWNRQIANVMPKKQFNKAMIGHIRTC